MFTLKGEVKLVGDVQQISDSFKKRELVVVDASGQYAQTILFQATQDRCELLKSVRVGALVEVTFFLRGREWTNPKDGAVRYFNSLDLYKCVTVKANTDHVPPAAPVQNNSTPDGDDDLPF